MGVKVFRDLKKKYIVNLLLRSLSAQSHSCGNTKPTNMDEFGA